MKMPIILVVDDEPDNFDVIEALLDIEDCELHYSSTGQEALSFLRLIKPDLILLDVMMPKMNGFKVCQQLKFHPPSQSIPVIMITALTSKQDLAKCFVAGAEDFISKPINRLELNARVRSMLKIREQHQLLQKFNQRLETTVQKRTKQLRTLVIQDSVTRLPTRTRLIEILKAKLVVPSSPLTLVIIDCSQFNLVNSSFGYSFGDQLLIAISKRLKEQLNSSEMLFRIGEDRFGLLIESLEKSSICELKPFLHKITTSFDHPFVVAGCEIFMTVLMGIAFSDDCKKAPVKLIQAADTALAEAKSQDKHNIQLFHPEMHLKVQNRLILETELQRALENQEFVTFYQPIVQLKNLEIKGFEALVRWNHPDKGLIPPSKFISSIETSGLIIPVGIMILRQACRQLNTWHQQGWSSLTMSVNISPRQFTSPTLLADIDRVLDETKVNPACLKFEITESAIFNCVEDAIATVDKLRSRQIQISIDDFGTGYSSLSYLNRFALDSLKIDQSFVKQFTQPDSNYPIVNTIVSLAKQLRLSIIAEGIETKQQFLWLQKLECDFGQGYFFSKPMPPSNLSLDK